MHIPIADHAGGVVVEPAKRAVKTSPVERTLGSRAEPAIVVDALRSLAAIRRFAAPVGRFVAKIPGPRQADLAKLTVLHQLDGLLEVLARPLLRTDLADPLVAPGCIDHGATLLDVVANRLLAVDILAGHAGVNKRDGVPVVGRADDHSVHVVPLKNRVKVDRCRWLLAILFLDLLRSPVQMPLVHVAKGNDRDFRRPHEDIQVIPALAAAADERNSDRLAGRDRLAPNGADRRMECRPRGDTSGRRSQAPRVFDEIPPIQLSAHGVVLESHIPRYPGRTKPDSFFPWF